MFGLILAALGVVFILIGFNRSWSDVWTHIYAIGAAEAKAKAKAKA
jgi:hypothetical protein